MSNTSTVPTPVSAALPAMSRGSGIAPEVLHLGVKHRTAEPEIEAEDHPRRSDLAHDRRQVGERAERLETDDDLVRTAREHLDRTADLVRSRINEERA